MMTTLVTPGVVSPNATYNREHYRRNTENDENHFIPKNQNHIGCEEINRMEEEELNKEEEGDDEDDDEEEERKSVNAEDSARGTTDIAGEFIENNNSKLLPRSSNKRKNFKPRSIIANESPEGEGETETEPGTASPDPEEKMVKNRRKRSTTPLRVLKPEVIDLSLKETREDSDSDLSETSRQTFNLKKYRHIKTKCHFDEKPQNLLSLLNNENNRFNNPFGIDLSKFNKNVAQNSPVEYVDDSDSKNTKESPFAKHSETESSSGQANDVSGPNQVVTQPGEASAMKEYAESTMRELLRIYGLTSTEMSEPITKNVHISNFSTGKILEKYDSVLPNKAVKLSYSPLSQPPTPPRTPLSPYLKHQQRRGDGSADGENADEPDSDSFESFRQKMAADLAKMAGLPSSSVLNSSRVMFPQNLSSMLSLAAMHEQGKADSQDGSESPPLSCPTILVEPKHGHRRILKETPQRA